jgi:hypothetical protein
MFSSIGSFANANPDAIRQIGMGFAVLSVTFMSAGAVALLAALGPAGWLIAGVGALAAAKYLEISKENIVYREKIAGL